ncbi:MAG: aspartate aminotransferase family protein [Chloroflexi bacterium]|nr:aspartate aminotransferase family protein [Chloroflexota bacterium]
MTTEPPSLLRSLDRSRSLSERAKKVLAGGVSSDARRTTGVPLYVERGLGPRFWDVDGNEYLDYVLGQGPLILGHSDPAIATAVKAQADRGQAYSAQHEREVEVAETICRLVPCAERIRFNSVGSEAVHAAWRLARAFTGRGRILKFEGHYHGWLDSALYSVHPALDLAGPPEAPVPVAGTRGQTPGGAEALVVAPWNDLDALGRIMERHEGEIAAVTLEPVLCNTGCISPVPGYLEGVRQLCREHGALLIFDEVITGFRLAPGGAQEYLGVIPDLAIFGKAVAGGYPLSVLAGRADVMDLISRGEVGHAGTFNSNPVVIEAASAALAELTRDGGAAYTRLFESGRALMDGIREAAAKAGIPVLVHGPGPVFQVYLTSEPEILDYRAFAATDLAGLQRLQRELLERGVNTIGRGLWFLSNTHGEAEISQTLAAVSEVFAGW